MAPRHPDAKLLIECPAPDQMPDKPNNKDIAKALEDTTGKWVWCRSKDDGLIKFENGDK